MRISIQIFLLLYGCIAITSGSLWATSNYTYTIAPMVDNSHRFLAAVWISTAFAFFYVAWNLQETTLFRFLMIVLFVGGIVRAIACINYTPNTFLIAIILLELIPAPILWWMHTKLVQSGSI